MWTWIALIVTAYFVYVLWYKVKALQKYIEDSKEITKFRIAPKADFWDLPLIREAVGIDEDDWYKPREKLTDKQKEKLGEWARKHQKTLYQMYTFFPDKELLFSSQEWGSGFFEFPYRTENIYSNELATTKDDYTIEFNIAVRWVKDVFPKQSVPIYVGYLKKHKMFDKKDPEMITLFQMPHAFINPSFIRSKDSNVIIEKLEKHFGLEKTKERDNAFGDFINDFGEQDWFNYHGATHETKYYEIAYPD